MGSKKRGFSSKGIIVSVVFHVLLVAVLVYLSVSHKKEVPIEQKSIEVSLATGKIGGSSGSGGSENKKEKVESVKKEEKKPEKKIEKKVEEPEVVEKIEKVIIKDDEIEIIKKKEPVKKKPPKKKEKKKVVKKKEPKKEKPKKKEEKKEEVAKKNESSRDDVLNELKKKAVLKDLKSSDEPGDGGENQVAESDGKGSDGLETTGTGGGESVNPVVLSIYFETISDKIERNLRIPPNIEIGGALTSDVSFRMYDSGSAYNVSIKTSSGNEVFDKSCIEAVKLASPFPKPPNELRSKIREEAFIIPCNTEG